MHDAAYLGLRFAKEALVALVPPSRRLPLRLAVQQRLRLCCERELIFLERLTAERGVAVDVGANVGLYAYRMSETFRHVYAFEPVARLTADLAACRRSNVTLMHAALSSVEGEADWLTPLVGGVPVYGLAGIADTLGPLPGKALARRRVPVRTLDSFGIEGVSLLKIDVEGHEARVLTGAAATIARDRPVVLAEVAVENEGAVFAFFADLAYRRACLSGLAGVPGSPGNHLFLPV